MRNAVSVLLLLAACNAPALPPSPGGGNGGEGGGDATGGACALGRSASRLGVADRKIAGDAVPYVADGTLRARDVELAASQRLRREAAWRTLEKVLAPAPLAEALPGLPENVPRTLPAWQTWYGRDELTRVFDRVYAAMPSAARAARSPLDPAALSEAFAWNTHVVETLPSWPADRWNAYVAGIDDASRLHGIGGVGRVAYAPGAARHLLASYGKALDCRDGGAPPAHDEGPPVTTTVQRTHLSVGGCASQVLGPYAIAEDERLHAAIEGGDAVALAWHATADGPAICDAAEIACAPSTPGSYVLVATAAGTALESDVVVSRESRTPAWASCVDGPFPVDAAVVKADWRRAGMGRTLPAFDTSASALAARMSSATISWDVADRELDPPADDVFTIEVEAGPVYRLAGLHVITKELDHWQWITLWWSDDPDTDFGSDRPSSIPAPFDHYKMCVTTAFTESDPDPRGGYAGVQASLGDALAAVHGGVGAPSWCSNPYVELGQNNAATNCIGCHQHGGTGLQPETILGDENAFPARGRAQMRNNFPTDYSWAIDSGDLLQQMFADEESYWANQ